MLLIKINITIKKIVYIIFLCIFAFCYINIFNMKEKEIGEWIRKKRLDLGLSQSMLAEKSDVTYQTIINVEKGNKASMRTILKILDSLDAKIEIV